MTLFDAYVFVDWSARNRKSPVRQSPDSIWIGESSGGIGVQESYYRTRAEAYDSLLTSLLRLTGNGCRVLLGFDFPYGYPAGFGQLVSGQQGIPAWRRVWGRLSNEIMDDYRNRSNRFEVASNINREIEGEGGGSFWGCHTNHATEWLRTHSPEFPYSTSAETILPRLRLTEKRIHGVQETWKLSGIGSVGSQALVGIPRVAALRSRKKLAGLSRVWPFETGFTPSPSLDRGPFILHAEIWPGIVKDEVLREEDENPGVIRDQAQVRCMCTWAARLDREHNLGVLFDNPERMTERELTQCVTEEGWILGCP